MIFTIDTAGWFSSIGDRTVNRRDLTGELPGTAMPWTFAKPVGILWHFTDGYNGDISGSMRANKYITAQMSIGRDGQVYQYSDIYTAHWHAYSASQWGIGVEHEAHPPDSNVTDVQLEASAEVFAAIIQAVKLKFHNDIPLVHVPGCDLGHPGIKEHADGLGCDWDPKGHSDKLYGWGWPKYLAAIKTAIEGEDVTTPAEKAQLARFEKYLDALTKTLGQTDDPATPATPDGAGVRVARQTVKSEKGSPGQVPKHSHSVTGQAN